MTKPELISGAYWVQPGKLLAGPYPHTSNWLHIGGKRKLEKLLDVGVTFFLDLTVAGELDPYASKLPDGIEHRRFSIIDMDVPTPDTMRQILDALDAALAAGRTVYVHCWGGIGRTGTVIGCFLVRHGMNGQAALDEIVRLRGGRRNSPQTEDQFAMVRTWAEDRPAN